MLWNEGGLIRAVIKASGAPFSEDEALLQKPFPPALKSIILLFGYVKQIVPSVV